MDPTDSALGARHPAAEAAAAAGDSYDVRVLEPSPPAVTGDPYWADDPASPAAQGHPASPAPAAQRRPASPGSAEDRPASPGSAERRPVVAPHSGGDLTWDDLVGERPALAPFAADRWLGARRPLPALPSGYRAALADYHRLAYSVVAEARRRANGKFGLRYTMGGFGTPFFGDDAQVRVVGGRLVVQESGRARSAAIGTLRQAAAFAGVAPGTAAAEHDSPPLGDPDRRLDARAEVGDFLGAWCGLAFAALEELRFTAGTASERQRERVQLWPGHFDAAIELGSADSGQRATYGFSPGDREHEEPYVYAGAWGDTDPADPFWNEDAFNGASLPLSRLIAGDDHCESALGFLRGARARLSEG